MSTAEAQVFARALYDSLVGGTLQALRAAAAKLEGAGDAGPDLEARITAALPPDAPREARNFLLTLAKEGTLDRLPAIIQAFERYGDRLELRFQVDPTLIGGLIIRVGDQVLDNSLRTRLSSIQRNMLAG